ncbi:hypothetical protein ACIA8G_37135 [Lentzea sp. NPDC051213]|uniref:hypothetical protein n=1 Tax=Lentzea sp. NPDC051213 TaxID=3364126 RepID=UPI0037932B15
MTEEAFAWMTAEYQNLVSAVVVAIERREYWPANEIAAVLSAYCYEIRDDTNWSVLCEIRHRAAHESGEDVLIANANLSHALYRFSQADFVQTKELTEIALDLGVRMGDPRVQSSAHRILAGVTREAGDTAASMHHLNQALAIDEQDDEPEGQALVLLAIAVLSFNVPDLLATEQSLLRALELTGSPGVRGHLHASLNGVYTELGRFAEVIAHQNAYVALQEELGNPRPLTVGTVAAARAKLALREVDEAFDLIIDVLDEVRLRSSFEEELDAWHALADLFDDCDAQEDALAAAHLQLKITDRETMIDYRIVAHWSAARAYRKLGDYELAAHHLNEMRALLDSDHLLNAGSEVKERALLHLALGEREEALRCAEESVAVHRRYHQRHLEGQSLYTLAAVRRAMGDHEGAAAAEVLAADAYRDCGVPMP